jgi:adenosine deaminase
MSDDANTDFIRKLPKAELHLHIEGTLEPELTFALARKHGVTPKYPSVEALRAAYDFSDLQSFLDLYYAGADVLRDEEDFHALTMAYLRRAHADGVVHTEIFFDPQTHTARGIALAAVFEGIRRALAEGEREFGISYRMIPNFLRHLSADDAMHTLEELLPYKQHFAAVGLDSSDPSSPRCSSARAARACAPSPMRARKGRRNTSSRRSTCSRSRASTTACAARKTLHWSNAWCASRCH